MEMQAGGLGADDDLVSRVLEIIGGALQSPGEPGGGGDWTGDEGDDSVFYSDEDQGHGDAAGGEADPRAFIREGPEAEEDRSELHAPDSDQSGATDPGSGSEGDGTTEAQTLTAASGTADPPEDKTPLETPNLRRPLPKPADADAPAGFRRRPRPGGYATLPTPKTSFDHLTSSKYATVSYRRIRRGNTRQKIEKFEHLILNL